MRRHPQHSILYTAYPLLPVSDESCGGAEQILSTVEREMSSRGYQTTVAACDSSRVSGELFATGKEAVRDDLFEKREAEHVKKVLALIKSRNFSLIHDHSGSLFKYADQCDVPVLATLHLPRSLY